MTEFISTRLFPEILNMSLTGSVVILAVLVIRFFLRKAPKKWSYLLWLVVAFRLICPVSLPSPVSLLGAVHAPVTTQGTIEYIPQNIVSPQTPVISPVTPSPAPSTPNAVMPDVTTSDPQLPVAPEPISVTDILPVIWLMGMAVVLIYSVVSYLRLRHRLAEAILYHENVWQSDKVHSPFILGLFRPRIYIPFGLDEQTLGYVLAHEHCHLKRKDHIIKPLAFLLLTLHWFNPLCWLAFHLMGRDMEMSCDEQVLAQENGDRKVYSTALLSFAANRRFPAPSPLAFGEGEVRPRIINALNWKAPKVWVTAAAGVLCVVVLLLCALNPVTQKSRAPFGHHYRVEEVVYGMSASSEEMQFAITPEGAVYAVTQLTGLDGKAFDRKITLTPKNFDSLFRFDESAWSTNELSAAKLREENKTTWMLGTNRFYCLLLQKNGDVYLAHGYRDVSTDPSTSKTSIEGVMKLTRNDWLYCTVTSNGVTTEHRMAWQPKSEYNYETDALPRVSVMKDDTITFHVEDGENNVLNVTEHYHFNLDGSEDTKSVHIHKLTRDKNGGFTLRISPRGENTGDSIVYQILCDNSWYSFRVDISPPTAPGQYTSIEDYVTATLAKKTQQHLSDWDGAALIVPVTSRRITWLEKSGELPGLAPEGTLEVWGYDYDLKLDVDPNRVLMAGGMNVSEDGWFSLDYAHNVVALLDADGNYTILHDESNNDGMDFWGGRTPEEAIHDWYVNAYSLTGTHPPYIVDWRDLSYTSNMPARRYDIGDSCYIYFPEHIWLPVPVSSYAAAPQWRSAYETGARFTIGSSTDSLAQQLRLAQAEGLIVTNEGRCYRIDYDETNSEFVYPYLDGERTVSVSVEWPIAPSQDPYDPSPEQEKEELFKIARSFAYYNAKPSSPETLRFAAEQAAAAWLSDLNATGTVIGVTVHRAEYDEEMTRNVMRASETEDTYACVRVEYSVCCDDSHPVGFSFTHPFPDGSGRYKAAISLTRDSAADPWQYSSMSSPETLELFRSVPPTEGEWTRMRGNTPEEAVQATLDEEAKKHFVSSLTVDSIQLDQTLLTYGNIKGLNRSELAQLMGWDGWYLDTNYAAVMARYTIRHKEPWNTQDGTYQTLFHLLRDESSGTWILMEPLSTRGVTIQDNPELEQALTAMIQEHYAPEQPDGLYHTQSYTVVDTLDYKRTAPDWVGWYRHLYTVVLNQSYDLSGATPRLVSESHSMDMITVTYTEADHYKLVSYRTPTQTEFDSDPYDTATYVSDKGVAAAANLSQYYPEQSQLCYERALVYKNNLS